MSLEIQFGTAPRGPILVEADRQGVLTLPSLVVRPVAGALKSVLLHRFAVRVTGDVAGARTLAPAYGGYPEPFQVFDPPLALDGEMSFHPFALRLADDELPPGTYALTAEVEYQPASLFPGEKPAPLATRPHQRQLEVPANLPRPCRITANWIHREVIVGRRPAELEILVDRLPAGGTLDVSVLDPMNKHIPGLRAAVESALRRRPPVGVGEAAPTAERPSASPSNSDNSTPRPATPRGRRCRSRSTCSSRRAPKRAPASEPGPAEYEELGRGTLKGKEQALLVDFSDNVFDGFPILDIGTSSLYAVIYASQLETGFLPLEQEQTYRARLTELLARTDGAFGTPAWGAVLAGAARRIIPGADPAEPPARALREHLRQNRPTDEGQTDSETHRVLRALELDAAMLNAPVDVRLAIRRALAQLHAHAFARFPLRSQRLIPVELDPDPPAGPAGRPEAGGEIVLPVPSTTEVANVGLNRGELELQIGAAVHANRREAMRSNPEALHTRFHSSPKIYYDLLGQLGETVPVSSGGEVVEVRPRDFLVAALVRLRERIDRFRRHDGRLGTRRFNKIVLTFPTSAKLNVRAELLKAAQEAGFDQPIADLDEALSALVFHLVKPFGNGEEMGLEAFRTACRPVFRSDAGVPREWVQNHILIDIGSSATDIALVEVRLVDETPAALDSALGRYYRLTPTLLGATGRGQLAGNLLTLYLFHDVKKRVADAVLAQFPDLAGTEEADRTFLQNVQAALTPLRPPFGSGGRYAPGSILEHYNPQQLWKDKGRHGPEAYRLVDRVVPTIWYEKPEVLKPASRLFQELWELAEEVKVTAFADRPERAPADGRPAYVLAPDRLATVLGVTTALAEQLPPIALTRADFLAAVDPPLSRIAEMAVNLVAARLTRTDPPSDPNGPPPAHKTLDCIVMT